MNNNLHLEWTVSLMVSRDYFLRHSCVFSRGLLLDWEAKQEKRYSFISSK